MMRGQEITLYVSTYVSIGEGLETSQWLRLRRGARQPHEETRVSRWLEEAMRIRAILQENDRSRWTVEWEDG